MGYYIGIALKDERKLYLKINKNIILDMCAQLKQFEKSNFVGYDDGRVFGTDSHINSDTVVELRCFDSNPFKMIGILTHHRKILEDRLVHEMLLDAFNGVPLCTADIFGSVTDEDKTQKVYHCNTKGVFLSFGDIAQPIFIPLDMLSCYSYDEIKSIIEKYLCDSYLKNNCDVIPTLPILSPYMEINCDGYIPSCGYLEKTLKLDDNHHFTNFEDVYKYARSQTIDGIGYSMLECGYIEKATYSLVSVSDEKNNKTYYIEISTPWGKYYYVSINVDAPLTVWLDMKLNSSLFFGRLCDGAIIPYSGKIMDSKIVTVGKVFGKSFWTACYSCFS